MSGVLCGRKGSSTSPTINSWRWGKFLFCRWIRGVAVFSSWSLFLNMSRQAEKAGAATTFCVDGREAADKNPTRYINAARTQEQPIWHYKFYMPSMAVYTAWLYEVVSVDGP